MVQGLLCRNEVETIGLGNRSRSGISTSITLLLPILLHCVNDQGRPM
jgi:hypothetical protein